MKLDLSRFRDTFVEEAREHLAAFEAGLLTLPESEADPELLAGLFRAVHSVKGASAMFGLADVGSLAHAIESVLGQMRAGSMPVTPAAVELLLRARDLLWRLLEAGDDTSALASEVRAMESDLSSLVEGVRTAAGEGVPRMVSRYRLRVRPSVAGAPPHDPLLLWSRLCTFGQVRSLTAELPTPGSNDLPGWVAELESAEEEAVLRGHAAEAGWELGAAASQDASEAAPRRVSVGGWAPEASIRVATAKVDELVNLAGELAIAQSVVARAAGAVHGQAAAPLLQAVETTTRNVRELQDRVLAVRMLPVDRLFARLPRLVHDVAAACGKSVDLRATGGDTELDRGVIERLTDPLMHLIRNAIDHGIEPAAEREQLGKPAKGVVSVSAWHEGGNVMIEIADDGRGLDRERIVARAVELGLVNADAPLTDAQAYSLIFEAGLSTAHIVTDVSGRGIGADVVRRNVEALNGTVGVTSVPGSGTRFLLKLPLTLAVLDGIHIRVGERRLILPLLSVTECVHARAGDLHRLAAGDEVLMVAGEPLPVLRLADLLAIEPPEEPGTPVVVIVANEGLRFGLVVDELLDPGQVVIKSLEANYRRIDGLLGATILGDGSVAMILDVGGLTRLARRTRGIVPANHRPIAAGA